MSETYGSGQVAPFPGLTPEKAAEIRDQVQARVDEERERYGGGGGGGDVPGAFVRQCLEANAMGDGMLYAELLGGRFLHAHATGVFVETISHVLGASARTMDPEILLDQGRSRPAGAPSPEIMGFHGARVAWMSETDNRRSLCGSMVKRLSGGDTMVGRNPHDKHNTEFRPTHTMFLQTNHKPRADGDDYALWRRLVLWPFEATFNEDPVGPRQFAMDPDLAEKLKAEAQGVAAWLVRGWLAWQRGGLPRCEAIDAATREYQRAEDLLGMFLEDCCDRDREGKTASTRLHDLCKVV